MNIDDILDTALNELGEKSPKKEGNDASKVQARVDDASSPSHQQTSTEEFSDDDNELNGLLSEMQKQFSQSLSMGTRPGDDTDEEIGNMIREMSSLLREAPAPGPVAGINENVDHDDFLDELVGQLLSKDLMYEPMNEVAKRFPSWLELNRDNISASDLERYRSQCEYFNKLIGLYETHPDNLPLILQTVQKIQEAGKLPPDLINEVAPGIDSPDGETALDSIVNGNPECVIA